MKIKKIFKRIGAIIGIILLGAIGSGFWSKILSPACSWVVDKIIRAVGAISISFKNYVYLNAAKGFHEAHSLSLLFLFLGMITGLYIGMLIIRYMTKFGKPREKFLSFARSNKEFILFHFFVLGGVIAIFFLVALSS
jgi:hypothetical protein